MRELEERLLRVETGTPPLAQNPLFTARPGPFTARILQTVRPTYAKTPKIAQFGGSTDLFVHMDTFKKVTSNKGFEDAMLCHLFSETLDGEAMSWFFKCSPGSMDSFSALSNAFLSRLILMTDGYHNSSQLFSISQGIDESLKSFVTRWRTTISRCRDLDKTMVLAAFKQGLRKASFLYHQNCNCPNATYVYVMNEAVLHAQAEYSTYGATPPPPQTPLKNPQPPTFQHGNTTTTPNITTPPNDKKREWQREIYDQCKDQIPPPPPRKYRRVGKPRNTGKWCKHHEDSSHNTNDCNALKTAIESLYRDGKLELYKVHQQPLVVTNIEPMRQINTIDGGAFIGSLSHRARKRYERANHPREVFNIRYDRSIKMAKTGWKPITFSEEEERGIHSPHDDPFLIDAVLDKWSVGRVLVSGSAVNVIFNGCYKQLQSNNKLLQDHEPLLSFSGDVTQSMGSDYMRLLVGIVPCTAEIHTEFIVVDCFSSYNAIIGRPTLNKLKCIIAGYMLLMKFPTLNGTGSVRGSQSIARECYSTTMSRSRGR
ncbi:uncharacterized protein LOC112199743 [Rosa chinensis]|uniref:uncharacterized protein LOC112199743 n=1 Tax=Rosa chinensis TaxID=74649 RepID=UPI000D089E31|nr:uncharacterized protein LOC112199743 [Rosa chinensis]